MTVTRQPRMNARRVMCWLFPDSCHSDMARTACKSTQDFSREAFSELRQYFQNQDQVDARPRHRLGPAFNQQMEKNQLDDDFPHLPGLAQFMAGSPFTAKETA